MDILLNDRVERLELAVANLYNCLDRTSALDLLRPAQRAVLEDVLTQVSLLGQAMGHRPMPR